ncbi:uncharacterized protein THITE_2143968 [Thermothielavioides terrestris NRRL 8126]|uniref:CCHC-type domain-containing protein n=2 Tax=Thermothielavioides terrestris TaxID=2587410 RepID=G2R030_THETT|nr:uncharacterized protein THITE_2143968 [Thermothielavioides terrestris NRRL 8126]AEO66405.1 hypothetical protein THITE_2143968 [Thermothielavioides terrestris NRRL 8126]
MATKKTTAAADHLPLATNNNAGNGSGDREVANKITSGQTKPKDAAGQTGKKKKSAEKPTTPAGGGPTASSADDDKWAEIRKLLGTEEAILQLNKDRELKAMLLETLQPEKEFGPICANPNCGEFGHTLAVCPRPTNMADGDMCGCFFCNVVDHDADECPMMEWVTPSTLVTHLITNRAGMPPWNTRIDWVRLAIDNWDLVCFALLPLTRAYVKREYIPKKRWEEVNGLSGITDPLFANADRRLLKQLANPDRTKTRARPLMEATQTMCYCADQCGGYAVFQNKSLAKYIPNMRVDVKTHQQLLAERAREVAECERLLEKKMPKKADKSRKKGRRALKKEAAAAAAAAEEAEKAEASSSKGKEPAAAGPSKAEDNTTVPASTTVTLDDDDDEPDVPLSDRLMDLGDQISDLLDNLRNIVRS